jgi:GAF domain-containing protein
MLKTLKKLLLPYGFEDETIRRKAVFLYALLYASIIGLLSYIAFSSGGFQHVVFTTTIKIVIAEILFILTLRIIAQREERIKTVSILLILSMMLAFAFLAFNNEGVRDSTIPLIISLVFISALFVDFQFALVTTLLGIATLWIIAYAETNGIITVPKLDSPYHYARDLTLAFIVVEISTYFAFSQLEKALTLAKERELQLARKNEDLQKLRETIEHHAKELEISSKETEKRAKQMQTIAEVSKAISSITEPDRLLPLIAEIISNQFGYYHIGIFLLDDTGKYAVLRATNSPGGKHMLARNHRLKVEPTSIVGYAASQKEPRIAVDVGEAPIYFDNPDLPETHSEIALPLIIGTQVIGVLDVQSKEKNAFKQTDSETLEILASNVAVAIQNSRLFGETRAALKEAENIYKRFIRQEWRSYRQREEQKGYLYDGVQVQPLEKPIKTPIVEKALEKRQAIVTTESQEDELPTLAVPIELRGETLGILHVQARNPKRRWSQEEINLVKAAAERAAIALENARLVDSAQQRAGRERLVSQITAKIRSTNDPQQMLQTATEELQKALGASRIQIVPYATPPKPMKKQPGSTD